MAGSSSCDPAAAVAAFSNGVRNTAVAACPKGVPEAAVAAYPEDLESLVVTQPFRLNNVALKLIRDSYESPPGKPVTDSVELTHWDPFQIGMIEHNKGTQYNFKPGETQPWSWRQMLAALTPVAKREVSVSYTHLTLPTICSV